MFDESNGMARESALKKLLEFVEKMDAEKLGGKKEPLAVSIEMSSMEKPEIGEMEAKMDPQKAKEAEKGMREAFGHPEQEPVQVSKPEEEQEDPSLMEKLKQYYESIKS